MSSLPALWCSAAHLTVLERLEHGLLVDNTSTCRIDKAASLLHLVELLGAEEILSLFVERDVKRDDICLLQSFVERGAVADGTFRLSS